MNQAHVLIFGFVQGVGFRRFVRSKANKLGLKGWVKNLPDGSVEAVFQSSASSDQEAKRNIEKVIEQCKNGPFLSEVEDVDVDWVDTEEKFKSFDIT